jgi:hypothetical protein
MNLKLISMTLGVILAAGGGSLAAQDSSAKRWSIGGGIGFGTDNLNEMTNRGTSIWSLGSAYNLDIGYSGKLADTTVPFRVSFGTNYMPSGDGATRMPSRIPPSDGAARGVTHSLEGYYLAADLFVDSKIVDSLQVFVGMSLNRWSVTAKEDMIGVLNGQLIPFEQHTTHSIPGLKFGGRLGLEFKASDQLAFNFMFNMVEVGHSSSMERPEVPAGERPWHASWFQIGAKFSF